MVKRHTTILGLLICVFLVIVPMAHGQVPDVRIENAFPKIRLPGALFLTYVPDGSDRIVVVEQLGLIHIFENRRDATKPTLALDIRDRVRIKGEEGLLGLAFHPDFKKNHYVYLYFTDASVPQGHQNLVTRFTMDEQAEHIRPESQVTLLKLVHNYENHDGGMLAFGPDHMLYIGVGDGGAGGDPHHNGQNKNTLLAKILRIDVDHEDPGLHYAVPPDNPFVGQPNTRGEIWSWGMRNPWRFSFDRQRGDLWCGDVGQDLWEEIDVIKKGGNYGWNIYEGYHKFHPAGPKDNGPFEFPIVEHGHAFDSRCIIGGYVYRGEKFPDLQGAYIYGDYVTNLIWYLHYVPGTPLPQPEPGQGAYGSTAKPGQPIKPTYIGSVNGVESFGEDRDGELYMTTLRGEIYHFAPKGSQ